MKRKVNNKQQFFVALLFVVSMMAITPMASAQVSGFDDIGQKLGNVVSSLLTQILPVIVVLLIIALGAYAAWARSLAALGAAITVIFAAVIMLNADQIASWLNS